MNCNIDMKETVPPFDKTKCGTIFDIKRFAIHDGPGIRTTFFFKGCPLKCQWCHNPESIKATPELTWRSGFCIFCHSCINACPTHALSIDPETNRMHLEKTQCQLNAQCGEVCPTDALTITGRSITAEEILTEAKKDRIFYDNSGGGITFSGGEPTAQPDFLIQCLTLCKEAGLHCTIDTSCYTKPEILDKIIPLADMFLCDIKHTDSDTHKKFTGVDNSMILSNIQRISKAGKPIIIRVPMIPGVNDSEENLQATRDFASRLETLIEIEYLPYNSGGIEKREIMLSERP